MFKITKRDVIFTLIGGAIGAVASYIIVDKKLSNEYHEKLDRVVSGHKDDDISEEKDDETEVTEEDFSKYKNMVDDLMYMASEDDISPDKEVREEIDSRVPDYEDDEVVIKRDIPVKKKAKPKILGTSPFDPDEYDPDGDEEYREDELFWLQKSRLLVNKDNNVVDMTDAIGNDLWKRGFMSYNSDKTSNAYGEEVQYVRNYNTETNYKVTWVNATAAEFDPTKYSNFDDYDEDYEYEEFDE